MIAADANIIIYALAYHLRLESDYPKRCRASAVLLSRRSRKKVIIPECFLGEVVVGVQDDDIAMSWLLGLCSKGGVEVAGATAVDMSDSILLRRSMRRGRKHRIDCLGYCIAARHGATVLATYDDKMSSATNRIRVPMAYHGLDLLRGAPACATAEELIMQDNPPQKLRKDGTQRKDRLLTAFEKRVRKRLKEAGVTSERGEMRHLCGVARAAIGNK